MLIRSQDKTLLVNMDTMQGLNIEGNAKVTIWHDGKVHNTLGYYSTEEKAIKVLDMIQDDYDGNKVIRMDNNGCSCLVLDKNPRIFIMPQDSEVDI